MNTYETWLSTFPPGWLLKFPGDRYMGAYGAAVDVLLMRAYEAIEARFIANAPADALLKIGAERGIEYYDGEPIEAYRGRVQGAWDFRIWGGTNRGIILALEQAGYTAHIIEHETAGRKNSTFSIALYPLPGNATESGAVFDDDFTLYDNDAAAFDVIVKAAPVEKMRDLVNKVKSAHTRLIDMVYTPEPVAVYDDGVTAFDDGDVSGYDDDTIEIYL